MKAIGNRLRWATYTSVLAALLVGLQAATAPMGLPLLTGSLVNMLLIVSVMTAGAATGLTVAVLSPVAARFLGLSPLWSLTPFIAAGNIVLVLLWHLIANRPFRKQSVGYITALAVGGGAKFLVLYIGIVRLLLPLVLKLPEQQAAAVSAAFSLPQLMTALFGGMMAAAILPRLRTALPGS